MENPIRLWGGNENKQETQEKSIEITQLLQIIHSLSLSTISVSDRLEGKLPRKASTGIPILSWSSSNKGLQKAVSKVHIKGSLR